MAPVPEPWEEMKDTSDNILYYNKKNREFTHEHPCDEQYREMYEREKAALLGQSGSPGSQPRESADRNQEQNSYDQEAQEQSPDASPPTENQNSKSHHKRSPARVEYGKEVRKILLLIKLFSPSVINLLRETLENMMPIITNNIKNLDKNNQNFKINKKK
jgi:hypothetical protein